KVGLPSVMMTATSNVAVDEATWKRPRSQFVPPSLPPGSVKPLILVFTVFAPAVVDTDVGGRVVLVAPAAGAFVANVKVPTVDGVPVSASTNEFAAALRLTRSAPTEFDRSRISATLTPHLAGKVGLTREFCQIPPEASLLVLPVEIMKSTVEL